jgi:hypothetical protein
VRIPYPERIPLHGVAVFAAFLFAIQILEGTALYFAVGSALFLLIATFAFNVAGGLTRASGAYVFFYALLVVLVGLFYKAFLGEPAQSNLLDPRTTIEVYVGGVSGMLAAVVVSRRFTRKSGLLQEVLKDSLMYRASIGCMLFGSAGPFLIGMLGSAPLQTAFGQLNQLISLGIIIGVVSQIRRSGGTRSLNLPIFLGMAYSFTFYGVLGFSKQGLLTPLLCWFLPVCALRFRLSVFQVAACAAGAFVVFYYLVPFSQYGRRFVVDGQSLGERAQVAFRVLENPQESRQGFAADQTQGFSLRYYDQPQGFWDRLNFVAVDDALINVTDQGKVFGYLPLKIGFLNVIPRVLWPGKSNIGGFGYMYLREITGVSNEGDENVGIAFSPTSEAYHMGKWVGLLIVAPLIWFLLFVVFDSLFGDVRATPWGLLAVAMISHTAPEGGLMGPIYMMTFGTEIFVFCALFASFVAPALASFVLGPDRRRSTPALTLQPSAAPQ